MRAAARYADHAWTCGPKKFSPAGWLGTFDYAFLLKRYVTFLLFPPLGD
jgi:hypothetical protein